MIVDTLDISIVRAEGVGGYSQSIGCYVQVDGRLHDVITPLDADNQENEITVPRSGLLRLIVKNMGNAAEVLGSVSLDLKILPNEGFQWLPLYCNMAKDQIHTLPEEVEKGKILILINPEKKTFTSIIPDDSIKESSIMLTEIQEYLHKEKSRHELEVSRIEKQYKGFIQTLSSENEKHKKSSHKYSLLFEDMSKELKSSKLLLTEERKLRLEVQEKMGKVTQEYEENLKRATAREDTLLRMLEKKDQEITDLTSQISQLKTTVRNMEHEKQQIVDVVDEYKTELTLSNITRLNQELNMVKSLLEESEFQRHKLQQYIQELPETPSKLSSLMSPISLGSTIVVEGPDDTLESKQIDTMLNELMKKTDKNLGQKYTENVVKGEKDLKAMTRSEVFSGRNPFAIPTVQEVVSFPEELSFTSYQKGTIYKKVLSSAISTGYSNSCLKDDETKTHRRGTTVGISQETDENEEITTVRGLRSPHDTSFIKNKSLLVKPAIIQTTTPLRERMNNRRLLKKTPFK